MLALCLDCSTAAVTTPKMVSSIWKLVDLKMLDISDHTRTGISILTSAADKHRGYYPSENWLSSRCLTSMIVIELNSTLISSSFYLKICNCLKLPAQPLPQQRQQILEQPAFKMEATIILNTPMFPALYLSYIYFIMFVAECSGLFCSIFKQNGDNFIVFQLIPKIKMVWTF